ncbi:DUF4114 domain-containing protein [Corallococcus exiguus]|nr:DUF4114 domain-containing protein [Corallococcus exiguus]
MAGGLLFVIPSPSAAQATGNPKAIRLPPQITGATQSTEILPPGGVAALSVQAMDPQGSPLQFSWAASAGTLGLPMNTSGTLSTQTWTAPQCLEEGDVPVAATVTNGYGLATSVQFPFSVVQDLAVNHQPPFSPSAFERLENVALTPQQTLRMTAPSAPTSAERIVLAQDQHVRVTFIDKVAGATHALGYVYYDDLVARGYVNTQGDLVDANGNGIADLHEDLYNLAPLSGPQARQHIGTTPRCTNTFTSGGFTYRQPELALNASCASAFTRTQLSDARPGHNLETYAVDVVGATPPTSSSIALPWFSDQGLFPRLPNLLEPRNAANNFMGLGTLIFLNTDDDGDTATSMGLGLVPDTHSNGPDGIPDYDVSRYDLQGQVRPINPDPGITPNDRTVDLGLVQGGREMVFFLVSAFESRHNLDNGTVYPCLRKAANGQCTLHLKTPLSVFFSKAKWNLDQDHLGQSPVAALNIGCAQDYTYQCTTSNPTRGCYVDGTSQKLCGWMDEYSLERIALPQYGSITLPREGATVPVSGNGSMPHVLLTAPSTMPSQWMLGFEDLPGGGDRDFNDLVILIQGAAGSTARSNALPAPDASCAVSRVRFTKTDTMASGCGGQPAPTYEVATNCQVCGAGLCASNPTPTWYPLPLLPGTDTVTVDVTPGNQVCWKVTHLGGSPACLPEVTQVQVGYELTPVAP